MKYRYIIFDCDGVLVDSEFLACNTLSEMLRPFGPGISPEEIMTGYVGMKDTQVIQILTQKYKLRLPEGFFASYETTLDKLLENNLQAIKGIEEIVKNVKLPKALVSNSNYSRIITSIKSAGLLQYFDEKKIFSAQQANIAKPDPGIYLYALKHLGISPEEALVIEDSPTGVTAAAKAGTDVIGFLAASHAPGQGEVLLQNGAFKLAHNAAALHELLQTSGLI